MDGYLLFAVKRWPVSGESLYQDGFKAALNLPEVQAYVDATFLPAILENFPAKTADDFRVFYLKLNELP